MKSGGGGMGAARSMRAARIKRICGARADNFVATL
jgi:hypothetical protein